MKLTNQAGDIAPLTCLKSGASHFSAMSLYFICNFSAMSLSVNQGWPTSISGQLTFWCEYGINQCFFQDFTDCVVILSISDWFDNLRASCCQS